MSTGTIARIGTSPPEEICRADGTKPFNEYLWPTESWWIGHEHRRYSSRWHFGYIALSDGRFAIEGTTWAIRENRTSGDRQCCFPTRAAAIRASAAQMIREMRWTRDWDSHFPDKMEGERLEFAINWTLQTAAKVTQAAGPRPVKIRIPAPKPRLTGMPLFDHAIQPNV